MRSRIFQTKNFLFVAIVYAMSVAIIGLSMIVFSTQADEKGQNISVQSVGSDILADGVVTAQNQATLHFQTAGN